MSIVRNTIFAFNCRNLIRVLLIAKIVISILVISVSIAKGSTGTTSTPVNEFYEFLDRKIPTLMARYKIPGTMVAVIKGGNVAYTNAYGYANLETGRQILTNDYCRVESISKSVTAWGVMRLVEQGRVDLDTPAIAYIKSWEFPKSEYPTNNITVRQLLNHTSGLPLGTIGVRYAPTDQKPSLRESLTQNASPISGPASCFEYSNVGYHILELLIEEVSGLSFANYMEQEVFIPLGMMHSSFEWRSTFIGSIPNGYDFSGNPIPPYVYPEKASGGLFTTLDNIARFVCAGMGNSRDNSIVLNKGSIQQLYAPSVNNLGFYGFAFDSYGFGHLLEELPNGKLAVSHGGQGTGWMTHFHSVPETGDGIIILTNSQRSWPFIAKVLTHWAQWSGFKCVGMSVISVSEKGLWIALCVLILLIAWQVLRVLSGISSSISSFSPFSKTKLKTRFILFCIFALISAIYIWAVSQEYIFFTSIFPKIAGWLVFVTPVLAGMLLLTVLFPKISH